ncbi:MAG: hypothetical protein LBS01_08830, partial [Prevotellaceae bacterium]|nr:hypothetical protein [Prevotellaceae bacterium]
MKRIFLFSIILISCAMNAQTFDYGQRWKEIETLSEQGDVKSLLPKIDAIFQQAKQDKNTVDIVNSLIFKEQILAQTQEDADNDAWKIAVNDFEAQIPQFEGSVKCVLQSLLAKMYENYANSTSWKRRNITETENPPADISEWTTARLLKHSFGLYLASVADENTEILQQSKTENYKKLLTSTEDIELFPTLFDVLYFRFYKALENSNMQNVINQNPDEFDKYDAKEWRFMLLTALESFHREDENKSAFLNCELELWDNFSLGTKLETADYIIKKTEQRYAQEPFSAYLLFRAAQIYQQNGDRKRAYEICKSVKYNKSNKWTENAKTLIAELEQQNLQIQIDQNNLPNAAIAVSITATNVEKAFYRIFKITESIVNNNIKQTREGTVKSGEWQLRKFDDFSEHSTIVALDGLPQGKYEIEIANNQNFTKAKQGTENALEKMQFSVNNRTVINLQQNQFQIINRKTGEPVKNISVEIYSQYWNRKQIFEKLNNSTTGEHGIFTVLNNPQNNNFFIYNPENKEFINIGYNHFYENNNQENSQQIIQFFTDRAIYRPGQTVYFKGILFSKNKNKAQIIKNQKITVELLNANGEKISNLDLTTNNFGSVFGEFILPQNALTGQFALSSPISQPSQYSFRVEEYKRPKFEVTMDTLQGEFVLEKAVQTGGKAISYAGANISDAKVAYRVERQEIFPYRCWWYPPVNVQNETIIQGETQTDSDGKFFISFVAKPANEKKKGEYRTYIYKIFADITDINGETHSATQSISIGDLPRKLELKIPEKSLQKDFTKIEIKSTTLNDVKQNAAGKIIVTQLIAPDRILLPNKISDVASRNYYYENNKTADYQIYDYQQFVKLFPHLPYSADETQPQNWKRGKIIEYQFDTEKSDTVAVVAGHALPLQRGFYLIQAISLYGNDTIKTEKIVEILDNQSQKSTDNVFFAVRPDKQTCLEGDKITLSFVSDIKNAVAIAHIESGGKWLEHRELPLKNGIAEIVMEAKPEYIANGLFVASCLVYENGYSQQNFQIKVIDKPKNLKISTKTFRNKLAPGTPETWELTISGEDKDKFTAEVLATMYDASLDVFASNSFSFNPFAYSPYGRLWQSVNFYRQYNSQNIYLSPYYNNGKLFSPQFSDLKDLNVYDDNRIYVIAGATPKMRRSAAAGSVELEMAVADAMVAENENVFTYFDGKPVMEDDNDRLPVESNAEASSFAENVPTPQIRKNLQETAFFYPNLYTDQNGDAVIKFTSPEALTKWKLLALAHTQDLHSGTAEFYAQTQKEL